MRDRPLVIGFLSESSRSVDSTSKCDDVFDEDNIRGNK